MAAKRGRPTKKKSATATEIKNNREVQNEKAVSGRRELTAILLFALAVLLLFLVLIKGQSLWTFLHNALLGIFGVTAYVLPVFLGTVAVFCALDRLYSTVTVRMIESSLLVIFIGAAIDIFSAHVQGESFWQHLSAAYQSGVAIRGGGFLGALIGHPIYLAFGKTGAGVTVCLIIFVLFMMLTGTTLIGLFRTLLRPVKTIEQQAGETFTHVRERRAETAARRTKPFEFDIPVDDIPEEREVASETLDEKSRRVVETYHEIEQEPDGTAGHAQQNEAAIPENEPEQSVASVGGTAEPVSYEDISSSSTAKQAEKAFEKDLLQSEEASQNESEYRFPPVSLLKENRKKGAGSSEKDLRATAENLVNVLRSFGVETRIVDVSRGPAVTRYELQPSAGVKISKITGLADDIALNLATSGVRIEAPIPNKAAVGIEVPNKAVAAVGVRDIIETVDFMTAKSKLTVALGRDIAGNAVITDIAKMPHGLIAGATGSGKSVCINSIIISLLYKATPDEVKLLMIDPKVVELGVYNGIPHLLVPVVTDPRKASGALGWAVTEMEKRYRLFAENDVRNLEGYNHLAEMSDDLPKMPHIVIIIDELADLMMTAPNEVEDSICRIAQKARAAGMHLIIATQRPSVDVVTGLIKANVPTRIAFAVSSQIDSRTIIDMGGAEKLLGKGDMLFCPVGANKPTRIQGCFVSDGEVERVVEFIKNGQQSDYDENINDEIERMAVAPKEKGSKGDSGADGEHDPMINQAIECVIDAGRASTSLLQSRLKLGYARAARIINELEIMGVVGPYEGAKPRQVLMSKAQFLEMQAGAADE